jgi:hypothetical protein
MVPKKQDESEYDKVKILDLLKGGLSLVESGVHV